MWSEEWKIKKRIKKKGLASTSHIKDAAKLLLEIRPNFILPKQFRSFGVGKNGIQKCHGQSAIGFFQWSLGEEKGENQSENQLSLLHESQHAPIASAFSLSNALSACWQSHAKTSQWVKWCARPLKPNKMASVREMRETKRRGERQHCVRSKREREREREKWKPYPYLGWWDTVGLIPAKVTSRHLHPSSLPCTLTCMTLPR
jgi:hypothetical protein